MPYTDSISSIESDCVRYESIYGLLSTSVVLEPVATIPYIFLSWKERKKNNSTNEIVHSFTSN